MITIRFINYFPVNYLIQVLYKDEPYAAPFLQDGSHTLRCTQ